MQLVTFCESGQSRVGLLSGEGVIDLSIACPDLPTEMLSLIQAGPDALAMASKVSDQAPHFALAGVCLESVIKRPPKIIEYGAARGAAGVYQTINLGQWAKQSDLLVRGRPGDGL